MSNIHGGIGFQSRVSSQMMTSDFYQNSKLFFTKGSGLKLHSHNTNKDPAKYTVTIYS